MSDIKKFPSKKIVLGATKGKLVRFSHLHAHEGRLNTESGKMERSVAVLIPKENIEDIANVKQFIESQKKAIWLDDKKKVPPMFWNCLRDGDEDTKQDGSSYGAEAKGCFIINAKTDADSDLDIVSTTRDEKRKFVRLGAKEIKSGDWGRVGVNLKAYTKGNSGVGAYLSSIQLVQKGDPLASHSSAEDDFAGFEDDEAEDPLLA